MQELKNTKVPTEEYTEIQQQISKAESEFNKLLERQEELSAQGKTTGAQWDTIQRKMEEAGNTIRYAKGELDDLVSSGKAFKLGSDTEEYSKLSQDLKYAENDLEALKQKHTETLGKMQANEVGLGDGFKKVSSSAKSAFRGIADSSKKVFSNLKNSINKVGSVAKKVFSNMHKDTKKQTSLLDTLKSRFNGIALSLLVFNWITRGFNAMITGMKEGLSNLAQYSKDYNKTVGDMVNALATLKNAFATAFEPILSIAIPYLTQLITWATSAVNVITQLFSALAGRTYWTKATKQTNAYAGAIKDVADEAKKAYTSLAAFDELNVLSKNDTSDSKSGAGKVDPSTMFEQVPIDSEISKFADKIKDILSKLFVPLKKAWNREGKFVMDSWKKALKSVQSLIKTIGKDFLTVWNQDKTVDMFADILHIIGDIGLVVANLAINFEKAWKKNDTGLHILENIRDIFAVIVSNIRDAADFTVKWSEKLNFSPLLEAFERFTKSIVPLVDAVTGTMADFYKQVLLPLGQWVLEKGLPDLLDVFTAFNTKVDWDGIRKRLSEFWDHVEPFAETIGEGLILFIGRLADALAEWVSSGKFEEFLTKVEDWMDNVSAEDVADALEKICKAIVAFEVIKTFGPIFSSIMKFIGFFASGGGAAGAAAGISSISGALTALAAVIASEPIKDFGFNLLGKITGDADKAEILKEKYNGITGTIQGLGDAASVIGQKVAGVFTGMPTYIDGLTPSWQVFEDAMNKAGDGVVYTDEQLATMRNTMGLTEDDINMIRQATLDANEDMRTLADSSQELWGATPQTLSDITDGLSMIDSGLIYNKETLHEYGDAIGYTDEAFAYLEERLTSTAESANQATENYIEAGKNAAKGFEKGLTDETGSLKVAAVTMCTGMLGVITTKLGIHSPSTVMAQIGKYLMSGLIQGVTGMKSSLVTVLNGVVSTITSIFNKMKNAATNIVSNIGAKISTVGGGISAAYNKLTGRTVGGYQVALAGGGITTGTTYAKIGEAGKEAVLPLENNTGWMDTLVSKINGSGTIEIVAKCDSGVLFKETINRNEIYKKQTGHSAYA